MPDYIEVTESGDYKKQYPPQPRKTGYYERDVEGNETTKTQQWEDDKEEESVTNNEIELASAQRENLQGLARVLVPATKTPKRHLQFTDEEDPFNLLDVADTYELQVARLFNACEAFVSIILNRDGNKPLVKQYNARQPIAIDQKITEVYTFVLVRTMVGENVQFAFRRKGDKINATGFNLVQGHDGHIVLKNSGDTAVENDEKYYDLIHRAKGLLGEFMTAAGTDPDVLATMTPKAIPGKVSVPNPVKNAASKGGKLSKAYFFPRGKGKIQRDRHGDPIGRIQGERKFSRGRALAIPVLIFSLWGTTAVADNFVFNSSERSREVFDQAGHSLPDVKSFSADGEEHKFQLASVSRDIAAWSPRVELSDSTQNLKGVRALTSAGTAIDLGENACETSFVDLGKDTKLKAVTDSDLIAKNLNVTMTKVGSDTKLEVCTTGPIGDTHNHVWLEAV